MEGKTSIMRKLGVYSIDFILSYGLALCLLTPGVNVLVFRSLSKTWQENMIWRKEQWMKQNKKKENSKTVFA